jgi:hypothetical protein
MSGDVIPTTINDTATHLVKNGKDVVIASDGCHHVTVRGVE